MGLVPHAENLALSPVAPRATETADGRRRQPVTTSLAVVSQDVMSAAAEDMDLVLYTSGEGEQHISRTFQIDAGTQSARFVFVS